MAPKISVIIPIFNQEDYLRKSLSCLQNNIFQDFEAILINDGSTDNSSAILQEYCDNDLRFRLLNKNRGG